MGKTGEEQQRLIEKETSQRNFRYNRYLLLRYSLAIFFFTNLYLLLIYAIGRSVMVLVPLVLTLLIVPAIVEHVKLYGATDSDLVNQVPFTCRYFQMQLLVNGLMGLSAATGLGFNHLFAFLLPTVQARLLIIGWLILGMGLLFVCLKRITDIRSNKDSHYRSIQRYEKILNKEG